MKKPGAPYVCVERLWPGSTVVCAASGPSLTQADLDVCRGRARVIVVNDAYRLAPWADALYAADESWWTRHKGVPEFAGLKFTIEPQPDPWPRLTMLHNTGPTGLERTPTGLRTGFNSGFQAVNLAVHLGAVRILLLGYNMGHVKGQRSHFYGDPPNPETNQAKYAGWIKAFATIARPLGDLGIEVLNCTPGSALRMFPMASLSSVLEVAA